MNHFNDLKLELQVLVSDFLGIAISELELVARKSQRCCVISAVIN